jgi:hypothetical protein
MGPRSDLSAEPDSVDGPAVSGPAGLIGVRPSFAMLRATVPWLLRRNDAGSSRLLAYMSGPAHEPSADLVEWMSLVARACRRARPSSGRRAAPVAESQRAGGGGRRARRVLFRRQAS